MNNPTTDDDDAGEFAALDTIELLAALLHRKFGEEFLRQAFSMVGYERESLTDAAEELEARGLGKPAAVLRDIAKDCPSGIESNPYDPNDNPNWSEWRRFWLVRRQIKTGELEADLRKHHAHQQAQKATKH